MNPVGMNPVGMNAVRPARPVTAATDVLDPALLARVRDRLAIAGGEPDVARVAAALRHELGGWAGDADLLAVLRRVQSELAGAGPLEPLLRDDRVTDILVNAPDEVWVDRGAGLVRAGVGFGDEAALRLLATRLASAAGRRLDDAQPWVDARLADGTRLHAVLPPIAPRGTCLSLRVLRPTAYSLAELADRGALPPDGVRLIAALVAARLAFLVTGGTGTGKVRRPCWPRCSGWSTPASGSCWSRMPGSCGRCIPTSSGWRPGRRTSKAPARSRCATWCGRRCGCARTGW